MVKEIMDGRVTKILNILPLNIIGATLLRLDNTTVLGGNMALTQRSLKTYWQPDFTNKIVILEEIDEKPSLVETMLNQMKTVGLFKNARAVIFGQVYELVKVDSSEMDARGLLEDLEDLVNYYNSRNYLNLEIDYSGIAQPGVPSYEFQDLQNKVGVEELTALEKIKLVLLFPTYSSVTRLETALLQFYQSKYILNTTKIIILWNPVDEANIVDETKTLDVVMREFAASINIPVFKSNVFGHQSYNLPIPFGTPASLYSEKTTSCQGTCSSFILEVDSPFK